jgi:putative hemolysin
MVRIILFSLFISSQAYALPCESSVTYSKTDGSKVELCFDKKLSEYVSRNCLTDCKARQFLSQEVVISTKELKGGKDPHSVACTKLSGKLFLYRDEKQNEYAFCEAEDGSSISADSIQYKKK